MTRKATGKPYGPNNPPPRRGRPKGARGRKAIITELANKLHTVTIQGERQGRTTAELVFMALDDLARQGDVTAARYCDQLVKRYGDPVETGGLLVVPETLSEEQWGRFVEAHNATVVQPDPLEGEKYAPKRGAG